MKLEWSLRDAPLLPEACWAEGPALSSLLQRCRQQPHPHWRVAQSDSVLVLIGPGESLPWVDSLVYLGRQDLLYLPTLWRPNLPYEWLVARLSQLGNPPWALVPPAQALGLSQAGPLP